MAVELARESIAEPGRSKSAPVTAHYEVTTLLGEGGDDADRPMGLAPGTSIGHHDVTALLGEGGMAVPRGTPIR